MITHTIDQAVQSLRITETVVSTDDDEIASISIAAGARVVRRPAEISGDTASSESALIHALQELVRQGRTMPDLVVFLQCTSPLRRPSDIDDAVSRLLDEGADSLLSVTPSHKFLWEEAPAGAQAINYDFRNRPRRQDMAPQFAENGSIYVFKAKGFLENQNRLFGKIALYRMDERSSVDIDTMLDMKLAELLLREKQGAE